MTKILIDLERLRYPNSGLANVAKHLALGLDECSIDAEISLYGPRQAIENLQTNFSIIERKSYHKKIDFFKRDYTIIHVTQQLSSYFYNKFKKNIKIVTLHDLNFLHEDLSIEKKSKMLRKVNANIRNADYLVCISNFVKEDVLKNKDILEIDTVKDILVIHNGIKLPEQRVYDLGRFSYLKNKKYIFNIGVLHDKKNQKSLIKMLPHITSDLVLVTSDEKESYVEEIENIIKTLKIENKVHFLNNITNEEKFALIQHAESMCHPSKAEGFGIPPIEAMALGKPVFLSTFTSLPEIGGDVAFYFGSFDSKQMADDYLKGLQKYNENTNASNLIKKWVSQFDYQRMAKEYAELYNRVLNA